MLFIDFMQHIFWFEFYTHTHTHTHKIIYQGILRAFFSKIFYHKLSLIRSDPRVSSTSEIRVSSMFLFLTAKYLNILVFGGRRCHNSSRYRIGTHRQYLIKLLKGDTLLHSYRQLLITNYLCLEICVQN
jgi:hypothetical protein